MHWRDFLNAIGVRLTVLPVRHDQALGTTGGGLLRVHVMMPSTSRQEVPQQPSIFLSYTWHIGTTRPCRRLEQARPAAMRGEEIDGLDGPEIASKMVAKARGAQGLRA
jgi:hypothetical protein